MKPIEINRVKKWDVEKILNKRKNKESGKVSGIMEGIYSRK